eukprot:TRINITY_DN25808_c0_g1_i1.p1 TRINITY_DN25808_c0_g1~~TRINITY_DN25808_c0_g1_i1.p1  ORF type:complete len:210 (+),score=15.88 TRINITY_DN25808_c0_g1_i1:49-678(+)
MKFFILLLSVAAIAFGMTLEECQQFQGGCESCTSAGCGFCNQFQGGSFCTNLTNAGAADCNNQNSAGDLMDIFYTEIQQCVGGCANAVICDECESLANGQCGWCASTQRCIAFDVDANSTVIQPGQCPEDILVGTCDLPCPQRTTCFNCVGGSDCGWDSATDTCDFIENSPAGAFTTIDECPRINTPSDASIVKVAFGAFLLGLFALMF